MSGQFSVRGVLDRFFGIYETDQSTGEEAQEEEVQEEEAPEVKFQSKGSILLWYSYSQDRGGKESKSGKHWPGPTRYAISRVDDIKSSFQLFLLESMEEITLDMTNLKGRHVFGDTWRPLDQVDLQAYMGLSILAGI